MPTHRYLATLIALILCGTAHGLLGQFRKQPGINNQLDEISKMIVEQSLKLDINLAVGKDSKKDDTNQPTKVYLQGLQLDFSKTSAVIEGADGYTSSRVLNVLQNPFYTDTNGRQEVDVGENAKWNLSWKHGSASGQFVCAFDVPEGVQRNQATVPAGRFYMSHMVWTKESLAREQARKAEMASRAQPLLDEKDRQMTLQTETNNPLKKAIYYRNAMAAMDKYYVIGMSKVEYIPDVPLKDTGDDDEHWIRLPKDLVLTTKGQLFSSDGKRQIRMGESTIRSTDF